jgi:NAD(P)-dependent dehydrogenase (short-subunit alcohol dehydrogenase family)
MNVDNTGPGPESRAPRHLGRTAVVTGAASGIGQASAVRLASEGARVVLVDIADCGETTRMAANAGGEAVGVVCDVSSPESVEELRSEVVGSGGGADILVHSAAIAPFQPFAEITFEDWRRTIRINLDSTFLMVSTFVPAMRARGWGRVICLASGTFHLGSPNQVHYVASKGGVIGLVRSLATEVGPDGVTVNAIAPGLIKTQGTLAGPHAGMGLFERTVARQVVRRTGLPEDLMGLVSLLASDESSFITGQTILTDGGLARA